MYRCPAGESSRQDVEGRRGLEEEDLEGVAVGDDVHGLAQLEVEEVEPEPTPTTAARTPLRDCALLGDALALDAGRLEASEVAQKPL